MPVVNDKDGSDHTMTLLTVDGIDTYLPVLRLPYDQEKEIRGMSKWKAREDDILICAYPKSGTHWLWEITGMLLNGNAERIQGMKEMSMLEALSRDTFDHLCSPRVLNTHLTYKYIPLDFKAKHCKIIYILRNPKDIAVSFYNHHHKLLDYNYHGQWEDYLPRFIKGKVDYGSWFNYVLDWDKVIKKDCLNHVHVVMYEDVKSNSVEEIRRLAAFLNIEDNEELFQSIVKACHFKKMKSEKDPLEDLAEWKNQDPGMYRKGEVGDWKNWFTMAQSEMFDTLYRTKLKDVQLNLRFSQ